MYAFIWRMLPGPWIVKALIALVLIAAAVFVLMQYVFPIIAPYMPFNDATVDEGALGFSTITHTITHSAAVDSSAWHIPGASAAVHTDGTDAAAAATLLGGSGL